MSLFLSCLKNVERTISKSILVIDSLKKVVKNYRDYKWVDIDYEYYMSLVDLCKRLENAEVSAQKQIEEDLVSLNICFELIKRQLEKYLSTIDVESTRPNSSIRALLFEEPGIYLLGGTELIEEEIEKMLGQSREEKLFVCFNYTHTMELYLKNSSFTINLIYIHGELNEPSNPIIFGYGDEMDPHYEKIENLNTKEFLDNMKSFGYFRTDNYQRVIRFVNSGKFTVKILGHSCGLSDRILLNTIFEHENCEKIKIYHYEKSPSDNDYIEKTQEISRHFKASKKGEMRLKIVPFDKYSPMPQNPKEN